MQYHALNTGEAGKKAWPENRLPAYVLCLFSAGLPSARVFYLRLARFRCPQGEGTTRHK